MSIYSDIPTNFDKAPFSNDLARVTDANAIKQAIRNIVQTFLGERLYDNSIGSSGLYSLFELDDALSNSIIKQAISDALIQNEPRATLIEVTFTNNPDANEYSVGIYFRIKNNPQLFVTSVLVNRVR